MSRIVFTPPPDNSPLATWARRVFQRILSWMDAPNAARFRLQELNAAPAKPEIGDIVLADGSNWNPGSGAGIYYYTGAAWTKL